MLRMLGFPGPGRSLQVRYPADPNLSKNALEAGIALAKKRPLKAQRLLDHSLSDNPVHRRAWVSICTEQGFPTLAQRYNAYIIAELPRRPSVDAFLAFTDEYCIGTYGLTFAGFGASVQNGLSLAVRKNRSDLQRRQDNHCLTLAASSLGAAQLSNSNVLLNYLRLLVRHPLTVGDMHAVRNFVVPVLREQIARLEMAERDSDTLDELKERFDQLRERFRVVTDTAEMRAEYVPVWFENLEGDNALLRG